MENLSRRNFLKALGCLVPGILTGCPALVLASDAPEVSSHVFRHDAPESLWKYAIKAMHFKSLPDNRTLCTNCPNQCLLSPGDRGICRSRVNLDGTLFSLAYGNPCSLDIDPVEKKPLYHFMPGTRVFSLAHTGCNFRCLNCQNWTISQKKPEEVEFLELFPAQAVDKALENKSHGMAYTYSEASTWYEYMVHTAELANSRNLFNLYISNGYINPEPLENLCRVIHGANINLKAFDDRIYQTLCAGRLEPVLRTLKTLHARGVHLEITNLVVPGYTDSPALVTAMCRWIMDNLGPDHPLHFLRFFPNYRLDRLPPTPVAVLESLHRIALDSGIHHVYIGNVPGHKANHTWCPSCGKAVIRRNGYLIDMSGMDSGKCRACGAAIPGVWHL
ncbi:MAG: AmmeMemoRadiSam system radical SAM enzyme [Pseudomonadota bacterium]